MLNIIHSYPHFCTTLHGLGTLLAARHQGCFASEPEDQDDDGKESVVATHSLLAKALVTAATTGSAPRTLTPQSPKSSQVLDPNPA